MTCVDFPLWTPFQMWGHNLWTGGQNKRKPSRCNEVYSHAKSNPTVLSSSSTTFTPTNWNGSIRLLPLCLIRISSTYVHFACVTFQTFPLNGMLTHHWTSCKGKYLTTWCTFHTLLIFLLPPVLGSLHFSPLVARCQSHSYVVIFHWLLPCLPEQQPITVFHLVAYPEQAYWDGCEAFHSAIPFSGARRTQTKPCFSWPRMVIIVIVSIRFAR